MVSCFSFVCLELLVRVNMLIFTYGLLVSRACKFFVWTDKKKPSAGKRLISSGFIAIPSFKRFPREGLHIYQFELEKKKKGGLPRLRLGYLFLATCLVNFILKCKSFRFPKLFSIWCTSDVTLLKSAFCTRNHENLPWSRDIALFIIRNLDYFSVGGGEAMCRHGFTRVFPFNCQKWIHCVKSCHLCVLAWQFNRFFLNVLRLTGVQCREDFITELFNFVLEIL